MSQGITRRALVAMATGAVLPTAHAAEEPPPPRGKTILTVQGRIRANGGGPATFDRAGLEALGTSTLETASRWQPRTARFEGVPMARLMQAVGAWGSTVTAVALDDYKADLPVADFERFDVLLALKCDGAYMSVRDKGPIWILYPYDSQPELRSEEFYNRAVWQVARLIVK